MFRKNVSAGGRSEQKEQGQINTVFDLRNHSLLCDRGQVKTRRKKYLEKHLRARGEKSKTQGIKRSKFSDHLLQFVWTLEDSSRTTCMGPQRTCYVQPYLDTACVHMSMKHSFMIMGPPRGKGKCSIFTALIIDDFKYFFVEREASAFEYFLPLSFFKGSSSYPVEDSWRQLLQFNDKLRCISSRKCYGISLDA